MCVTILCMHSLYCVCTFFSPDISLSYYIAYLHNLCIFFMPFKIYIYVAYIICYVYVCIYAILFFIYKQKDHLKLSIKKLQFHKFTHLKDRSPLNVFRGSDISYIMCMYMLHTYPIVSNNKILLRGTSSRFKVKAFAARFGRVEKVEK